MRLNHTRRSLWLGMVVKRLRLAILVLLALGGAVVVFFNWQRTVRESRSRAEEAPNTGRFVRISDGAIYIQETGVASNRPILFIHGTGAWSELWRDTLDRCPALGQYCVAIDVPPFGFSELVDESHYTRVEQATRILDLMQRLRPNAQYTLVGHSFGAGPTVEAVMRDPSHVRALVVVDGALGIDSAYGVPGFVSAVFSQRLVRNGLLSTLVTNPLLTRCATTLPNLPPHRTSSATLVCGGAGG